MNREMIELLISSKKNDEKIIKKLTVWFTNNSLLIDEKYLFDRNVFHLLIKKINSMSLKRFARIRIGEEKR